MKKLLLLGVTMIFSLGLFSQQTTIVSCKLLSHANADIRLYIENFDLTTLQVVKSTESEQLDNYRDDLLKEGSVNDLASLVNYDEYRAFLMEFIHNRVLQQGREGDDLEVFITEATKTLSGYFYQYCVCKRISDEIYEAYDVREKRLLKQYYSKNLQDQDLKRLIESVETTTSFSNNVISRRLTEKSVSFLVMASFLFVLLIILTITRRQKEKMSKRMDGNAYILYVLYFVIGFAGFIHLINGFHFGASIHFFFFRLLRVLIMSSFGASLVFWLIPRYLRKPKFPLFLVYFMGLSGLYFLSLRIHGHFEYPFIKGTYWSGKESLIFFILSWLVWVPVSFLIFFLRKSVREKKSLRETIKHYPLNRESIGWMLVVFFLLFRTMSRYTKNPEWFQDVFVLLLGVGVFLTYAFYIVPKYLIKEKIGGLVLASTALLVGSAFLLYSLSLVNIYQGMSGRGIKLPLFDFHLAPRKQDIMLAFYYQLLALPAIFYAFERKAFLAKLKGFRLYRQKEAELNQLRSQVNPHFLFNSLNTVYAFALKEKNQQTAEYIAKLSNLMRYLIDDMEKDRIPLQKEIDYIHDYINMQKIRSSVEHDIQINVELDDAGYEIAPMLMIPFVENAFKYGVNPNKRSELRISIKVEKQKFNFEIENSFDRELQSFYKEKGFGIGIENVKQRLEHIYPAKHSITVSDKGNHFFVGIRIDQ